jgi:hypothetical protein
MHSHQFENGSDARTFALAGNAYFTLVSKRTGARFTYRVSAHKADPTIWFVSVLTGPENSRDYTFLGTIFRQNWGHPHRYIHGRKSSIGADAPSARAFAWAWERVAKGEVPAELEVLHEGRCGKCGRRLTVPESIASGVGPECAARLAAKAA